MNKFLIILLLPILLLAQDSWIGIEFQFDSYAEEVSWSLSNDTAFWYSDIGDYESQQVDAYEFIELNSGDYVFELNDSYGDGLSWPFDGYCLISNSCQDTLFYASGDYGLQLIESLTIAPCAPPITGCMDEIAINYNPDADISDQSLCEYPACEGWGEPFVDQLCDGGQALLYYNWETSDNPNCNVIQINYAGENTNSYTFDVSIDYGLWGVYTGNGQMPPNWEEEYSFQVMYADSTLSDTFSYTPYPCTQGCTDADAPNYNPWANVDDGSCGGQACDAGYTPVTIEVTLDNWPGETGWSFVSGDGSTEVSSGDYNYQDVGQTFTYNVCAMEGGFEFIVSDTYGDGMAGSTTGGDMDGNVVIRGCDGAIITQLSDGDWVNGNQEQTGVGFGSVAYSTWQQSTICETNEILGCIDPGYQEFNLEANIDDGTCLTEHAYGCIEEEAFNYDETATAMEIYPNCSYELWIGDAGADGWGNSFLGVVQGSNTWSFTMGPGEYEQTFPIWLETDKPVKIYYFEVGGAQTPLEEVAFQTLHNSFKLTNADGEVLLYEGWNPFADNGQGALQPFEPPLFKTYEGLPFCGTLCVPTIEGCMDSESLNYNEEANTNDGSCIEIVEGCTNELAFNYNENANYDDGSCVAVVIGCMDNVAYNYNIDANTDGGGCIYLGCTDETACNYDIIANADSGGCVYSDEYYDCNDNCLADDDEDGICNELEVPGCTIVSSINYNPEATDNDGSCVAVIYGCTDETALNYDSLANTDNGSCVEIVEGCTSVEAFNYNALANVDDGSCVDVVIGCMDNTMFNYDPNANTDSGNCEPIIIGCMDDTMWNYNPLANTDSGWCIPFIYGCNDETALNYDIMVNTLDNTCCYIGGCMDSTALNYDELACYDDGSCVVIIEGCADPNAYNYDPLVNLPDNTVCLYDAGCYSGPGEPYWLNDPCYAWVIEVDDYCCGVEWDSVCESMYNYCGDGWPIDARRFLDSDIVIYPNPTKDILTIETRLDINVELYNMLGEAIIIDDIKKIDLSNHPNGIYNLIIKYDRIIINKKIIKQ